MPSSPGTAAQAGDAVAQYELGRYYAEGVIVERDPVTAAMWLSLAAQGLDPERRSGALAELYELERTMTPAEIEEARARAKVWRKRH